MLNGIGLGVIVIFLATLIPSLLGLFGRPQIIDKSLFRPYWFLRRREYPTVITSGFVHADGPHLFFNLMTFYFFAPGLERVIGTVGFIVFYLVALVLSHAGTWWKQRNNPNYASLGASGAISAVLFASIIYFPTQSLFIIPIPVPIPAPLFAVGYLAYSWYASRTQIGRVNHDAHLGGAVVGLLYVAVFDPAAYGRLFDLL
ncbi:MAG: rhomboid family intramembrane serine protease [Steroidobacteraceae bacterium]